jgi:anti-sigma factor RsiW
MLSSPHPASGRLPLDATDVEQLLADEQALLARHARLIQMQDAALRARAEAELRWLETRKG